MAAPELERDEFDVVVFGTGLAESIAAAALAKAGKTVLHLDQNEYYAAAQASLTLDELVDWSRQHDSANGASSSSSSTTSTSLRYSHASCSTLSPELEKDRRRYALSLFPAVLPSRGELIDILIKSDVSKYVSFRMLDSVSIWNTPGSVDDSSTPESAPLRRVPGSKEEVFKDKSVSLMEKRRLMKFLLFAAGDFEEDELLRGKEDTPLVRLLEESFALPPRLSTSVAYAISHCSSASDASLLALKRTRRYLRSVGRYGSGAFLVGQYGGAGEVAQGFCRACAVFGGTYVLGASARPTSITTKQSLVELNIPCHPRPVRARHIVTSDPTNLPDEIRPPSRRTASVARCIAILDHLPSALRRPPREEGQEEDEGKEEDDTAIVIFPPDAERKSVVRALIMGEGTGSCPAGQFVVYLSTAVEGDVDPKDVLQPYLHRLSPAALFESYHIAHHYETDKTTSSQITLLSTYSALETLTEGLDWEAEQGRKAYSAVMGDAEADKEFFEKQPGEGDEEVDEL